MKTNRMLVSATALFAVIILSVSITASPAHAFWPFGSNKPKQVKVVVPSKPDTIYVDEDGKRVPKPGTTYMAMSSTTPTATSSYSHTTEAKEGGWGLSVDAQRQYDASGKHSGTSVGLGLALGRYSASVSTSGTSSFQNYAQNVGSNMTGYGFIPMAPSVGTGMPMNIGLTVRPACYDQYAPHQLVALFLYSTESKDTFLKLRDTNENEFDVQVPGCSLRDRNGTIVFVPVGTVFRYKLEASGWDTRSLVIPSPYNSGWKRAPNGQMVAEILPVNPGTSLSCASTPFSVSR